MSAAKARFFILMGPPGAGKGTQAQVVAGRLGLAHIATGDLFREAMAKQTELGKQAESFVKRGEYVPDSITLGLFSERLQAADALSGAILDGFPRTLDQADGLDRLLADRGTELGKVVYLDVPESDLMARLTGRWTCRKCSAPFHQLYNPPKQPGACDICGGELYQRTDDTPEVVVRRLQVYNSQTAPLVARYEKMGKLVKVAGDRKPAEVTEAVLAILG